MPLSSERTLSAKGLSITTPAGRVIIQNLNLSLSPGTKLALIGAEGAGKSCLLRVLAGLPLRGFQVTGSVTPVRCGYLAQGLEEPAASLSPLAYLLGEGADGATEPDWERYPEAQRALLAVGLPTSLLKEERPLVTLSGGENVRLRTAKLLLVEPEVLLLDEPTNYLDLQTLQWLENFIRESPKPIAFVSHDEQLITACANQILFLQHFEFKNESRYLFSGEGYHEFLEAKEAEFARVEAQCEKQQTKARKLKQQYLEAQRKSEARTKASQPASMAEKTNANRVQGKIKAELAKFRERFENASRPAALDREEEIRIVFPFACVIPAGKKVVEFTCATLASGDKVCARNLRLSVVGPEKVVLIGRNGAGKSTLLRQLEAALSQFPSLRVGYIPQNPGEILTEAAKAAVDYLDAVQPNPTLNRTTLRRFNFERGEMQRPVSQLSGGQRVKLLLARAVLSGANVLLLDEPTANLSPLSSPALRAAVKEYPGAVIAISHDRGFIQEVATAIYELTAKGLVRRTAAETGAMP